MSQKLAVIDYGMGNLRSVAKALEHIAPQDNIIITNNIQEIKSADRIIFPGVGAMPDCIRELEHRNLKEIIIESAKNKPFMGICLGMQALFEFSEEGNAKGLGILPGTVKHFTSEHSMILEHGEKLKVPHIGWNEVKQVKNHAIWKDIAENTRFYFVHSYFVDEKLSDYIAGTTAYPFDFTCAVHHENIFAVQFHPEKSQNAGLKLLKNFIDWKI